MRNSRLRDARTGWLNKAARTPVSVLGACALLALPAAAGDGADQQGLYSAEQAERGERIFMVNCATCHGFEMIDYFTTYGDAEEFYRDALLSPQIRPDQHLDLVAFMLSANGFPAGNTELVSEPEVLQAIVPALGSRAYQEY